MHGPFGEKHDDGGAQQKPAHLIALLQRHTRAVVVPGAHILRARWVDDPVPGGGHTAYDGGADQYQHHGAVWRVEQTNHPLIACKETWHASGRGGVDREQIAGHINHAAKRAIARHVDAMVVAWTQVKRGEVAVLKQRCHTRVTTDECGAAVAVALGLKNLVVLNTTELTDASIDRADPSGLGYRPRTGFEGAGEEVVEAGVVGGMGVQRLGHVHAISADEPFDETSRASAAALVGDEPGKTGQAMLRDQVLRQNTPAVGGVGRGLEVETWWRRRQIAAPYKGGRDCIERVFLLACEGDLSSPRPGHKPSRTSKTGFA